MTYTKQTWADGTGGGTPLSSARLNHMEDGIALVDGKAPVLTPTATKTAAYTLAVGDFVPIDATSANVPLTLPTAPVDGTRVGGKLIATAGGHTATFTCGGSDKINATTGGTTYTLSVALQAVQMQYQASSGVWIVMANDLPLSQLDSRYAPAAEQVNPVAASGAAQTIDLSTGSIQRVVLSANCMFTFPAPAAGVSFTLILVQDATGSRLATWPGSVNWGMAGAPVLSTAPSKEDWITFVSATGASWKGFVAGQGF